MEERKAALKTASDFISKMNYAKQTQVGCGCGGRRRPGMPCPFPGGRGI